jgi:hypothetical protein
MRAWVGGPKRPLAALDKIRSTFGAPLIEKARARPWAATLCLAVIRSDCHSPSSILSAAPQRSVNRIEKALLTSRN